MARHALPHRGRCGEPVADDIPQDMEQGDRAERMGKQVLQGIRESGDEGTETRHHRIGAQAGGGNSEPRTAHFKPYHTQLLRERHQCSQGQHQVSEPLPHPKPKAEESPEKGSRERSESGDYGIAEERHPADTRLRVLQRAQADEARMPYISLPSGIPPHQGDNG